MPASLARLLSARVIPIDRIDGGLGGEERGDVRAHLPRLGADARAGPIADSVQQGVRAEEEPRVVARQRPVVVEERVGGGGSGALSGGEALQRVFGPLQLHERRGCVPVGVAAGAEPRCDHELDVGFLEAPLAE